MTLPPWVNRHVFTFTGILVGSRASVLAGLFTDHLTLVVRFTSPRVRTPAGKMLSTFANATVHRFDAILRGVAKAIAIKTNDVPAFSSFVIWRVTFPTRQGLAIMIQANHKFPETQITGDGMMDPHSVIKNSAGFF